MYVGSDSVSMHADHFLRPMRLTVQSWARSSWAWPWSAPSGRRRSWRWWIARERGCARCCRRRRATRRRSTFASASTGSDADNETLAAVRRAMRLKRMLSITYRSSNANEPGSARSGPMPACSRREPGTWWPTASGVRGSGYSGSTGSRRCRRARRRTRCRKDSRWRTSCATAGCSSASRVSR